MTANRSRLASLIPPLILTITFPALVQAQETDKVVVQGEKDNGYSNNREVLAGKIVLGRDWIKNTAASSVAEALRHESSVSVGAGGKISLKGLSGYTQVLLDGEPHTSGKDPLQMDTALIERIEIIHSASADSGAFAIAGTINVVTRQLRKVLPTQISFAGGFDQSNHAEKSNYQGGWREPSGTTFNLSAEASNAHASQNGDARWTWAFNDGRSGRTDELTSNKTKEKNLTLSPSLYFKLTPADHWQLKASLFLHDVAYGNETQHASAYFPQEGNIRPMATSSVEAHQGWSASFRSQWRHQLDKGGQTNLSFDVTREQSNQKTNEQNRWTPSLERSMIATENAAKYFVNGQWVLNTPNQHGHKLQYAISTRLFSNVGNRDTQFDGATTDSDWLGKYATNFRETDWAAWVQDDWNFSETLDLKLGWRIEHRSMFAHAAHFSSEKKALISAPSVNLAWKLDPEGEQTLSLGLARTFSGLGPAMLNPRPDIRDSGTCLRLERCGANDPLTPDRAGNPLLTYENSWGVDLGLENLWKEASRWSIRTYHRRISDTFAWATRLESVPWANVPRWVMRPRNLGNATAQGISLAVDTHLTDWLDDAPDLTLNASVQWNHSTISTVPAPDNRLEKQQPWSWRLGTTYKLQNLPLELQADLLINPSQWWQASLNHRIYTSTQRDVSIKTIWAISPKESLVFSIRDSLPQHNQSLAQFSGNPTMQVLSTKYTRTHLSLRWELKFE